VISDAVRVKESETYAIEQPVVQPVSLAPVPVVTSTEPILAPSEWYYSKNGIQHGPIAFAEIKALAVSGGLLPADLVWKEGLPSWQPADKVEGIFSVASLVVPPPLPTELQTTSGSHRQRIVAVGLAMLMRVESSIPLKQQYRRRAMIGVGLLSVGLLGAFLANRFINPKAQAEAFLAGELNKWVAGQSSTAPTLDFMLAPPPVSYQIKSIYAVEPTSLDKFYAESGEKNPACYQANVDLEATSRVNTPLHKLARYRLVKHFSSGKWIMGEEGPGGGMYRRSSD
jgi:hypothetical protein